MTTADIDISTELPNELRKRFEAYYLMQPPVQFEVNTGSCRRCGASVHSLAQDTHELWHKNVSCRFWMLSQWPVQHLVTHREEGERIAVLIGSILGFIDPQEGVPSTHPTFEGSEDELKGDGKLLEHRHVDGTVHTHE